MPGKAAVVLTAAALSVTVGVLIGIVLIIGSRARQSSASATPPGTAVSSSESSVSGVPPDSEEAPAVISVQGASSPADLGIPESTPATPVVPTPASTTAASTTASTPAGRPAPVPRPATRSTPARPGTTRPAIVFTTVTVAPPTSRSAPSTSPSTSTPVDTTTSTPPPSTAVAVSPTPATTSAATSAANGARTAGQPCRSLGDKATAAAGNTLYCQTNFSNGSLAWRAVVDGGGCLSKKMTGIGVDGQNYVCRPDRKGLDFWRRG